MRNEWKRVTAALLAAVMGASLTACGGSGKAETTKAAETTVAAQKTEAASEAATEAAA